MTSPKTEQNAGGGKRVIPITEDFRQYLEDVLELSGDTTHVFPAELRDKTTGERGARGLNMRTQLEKIATRAGVVLWPKPYQNLRSSYETDMADRVGLTVAAKLVGNATLVAMKHYVDVKDETFEALKATRLVEPKASPAGQVLSVQKRERSVSETPRNGKNDTKAKASKR